MLEIPIFKMYYEHPIFSANQRNRGDEEEVDSEGGEGYTSIVSGMKRRREQRKNEANYQKRKGKTSEDDQFLMRAQSANRHIAAAESKNMIEFLRLSQASGIYSEDEMKNMFSIAKENILHSNNNVNNTINDEDTNNNSNNNNENVDN